jgi:PPP family 3-phenylpropionic acid transporter
MTAQAANLRTVTSGEKKRLSTIYFFNYFASSALIPYIALYYSSVLGLSGAQIGTLLAVSPLISLFATPFWTGMADARSIHRRVLLTGIAALAGIYAFFPFLTSFAAFFICAIVLAVFASPVSTLQDSAAMHMLGTARDQYGRVRIWGTVGWGVGAPLFGLLLDSLGLVWMFWIYALLMLVNLLMSRRLEFDQEVRNVAFMFGVRDLLRNPRWLLFFGVSFVAFVGIAANGGYMALLIEQLSGSNPALLGIVMPASAIVGVNLLASTIFEAPVMFFSSVFMNRLGTRGMLLLSLAAISLRNVLYAFVQTPDHVLLLQTLHGLTFATLWIAGVNFVAQNAPRGLGATAQGLFNTVTFGLGLGGGNFIGGLLLDWLGVGPMLAATGALVFIGLIVTLVLDRKFRVFS